MSEVRMEGPGVSGTNADAVTDDTRNAGAPELTTNLRSAFDPEPHALDAPTWDDNNGRSVMVCVLIQLRSNTFLIFKPGADIQTVIL